MNVDELMKDIEALPEVQNYEQYKKERSMSEANEGKTEKNKRMSFKEWYRTFDEDITFVVGYRNLFNIAVMFVSAWYMFMAPGFVDSSVIYIGALIMLIMGMKWFLIQVRWNLDELYIVTTIAGQDEMKINSQASK
jgi:hypothetical protein